MSMDPEPRWKTIGRAVEYWVLAALVAGAFVAGAIAAVRFLFF